MALGGSSISWEDKWYMVQPVLSVYMYLEDSLVPGRFFCRVVSEMLWKDWVEKNTQKRRAEAGEQKEGTVPQFYFIFAPWLHHLVTHSFIHLCI